MYRNRHLLIVSRRVVATRDVHFLLKRMYQWVGGSLILIESSGDTEQS